MTRIALEEARALHGRVMVFDGHDDTPVERVARGEIPFDWMERNPAYHVDVPRMKEGGYDGGIFIVGNGAVADCMVTMEHTLSQIEAHPHVFRLVRSSADLEEAWMSGRIGVLMGIEGIGRWLDGKADRLRLYYRLGLRAAGITHGEGGPEEGQLQGSRSAFGPCTPADREEARKRLDGLTGFGCEVLRLSNELGILTDLAHINDRAFFEVLERSDRPVVVSHTAVFSLCPHWRCLTDDQIRVLAEAGGVMGIAFAPMFIHPEEPTIERIVDHVCYAADLAGIDHVGIGTDFDGLGPNTPPVLSDVSQLPLLTQKMMERGLSEEEIVRVWGGNFLRVLRETIDPV